MQGYPLINSTLYLRGSDMTVLGLSLETTDNAAINLDGYASGSGLSIFNNLIDNEGSYGIWFENSGDIGTAASPVSIWGNTISVDGGSIATGIHLESYTADVYARVRNNLIAGIWSDDSSSGIRIDAGGGSFYGDISGNTITGIWAEDAEAFGIYGYAESRFIGAISGNTIGGVSASGPNDAYAYGIYRYANGGLLGGSIINNSMEVSAGDEAYGLYALNSSGSLGTASSPLIFTGNSGTINGSSVYVAYLTVSNPAASNVWIGSGKTAWATTTSSRLPSGVEITPM
jgi:hypothetical protein